MVLVWHGLGLAADMHAAHVTCSSHGDRHLVTDRPWTGGQDETDR